MHACLDSDLKLGDNLLDKVCIGVDDIVRTFHHLKFQM